MSDVQDHPEYRGLLAAVRAAPDDDLPRLVLADWLEEHESSEWAEFIRAQCEVERHPHAASIRADTYTDAEGVLPDWQRALTAARLARELWPAVAEELFAGELNEGQAALITSDGRCVFRHSQDSRPEYELRRGFVERVACPEAVWTHEVLHRPLGPLIVARQPVREVRLTGKRCHEPGHYWHASVDDKIIHTQLLPWNLAHRLTGCTSTNQTTNQHGRWQTWYYPSPEAAMAALSRAAIAWAEEQAGL